MTLFFATDISVEPTILRVVCRVVCFGRATDVARPKSEKF